MNSEPELLVFQEGNILCQACGITFDKSGQVVEVDRDKLTKKQGQKKA